MKIILLKEVKDLGKVGDQKDVADGFARNFLIPNNLAQPATTSNVQRVAEIAKEGRKEKEKDLQKTQKDAEKIDGEELVFKMKTDDEVLFGSVDKAIILEKISALGISAEGIDIELEKPIKDIGEFSIKVTFDHGIEATIKVIVEKE